MFECIRRSDLAVPRLGRHDFSFADNVSAAYLEVQKGLVCFLQFCAVPFANA